MDGGGADARRPATISPVRSVCGGASSRCASPAGRGGSPGSAGRFSMRTVDTPARCFGGRCWSAATQSRAVGRPFGCDPCRENARSNKSATSRVTPLRPRLAGGGCICMAAAFEPYAKRYSLIARSIGTSPVPRNRPENGCRAMNSIWKMMTARPKLSWFGVLILPL